MQRLNVALYISNRWKLSKFDFGHYHESGENIKNLAHLVLDYLCFLEFTEDDDLDPDVAVKGLESLSYQIEQVFSDSEKAALSEAPARRLEKQVKHLTPDQLELLQAIAGGNFNGTVDDDDSKDNGTHLVWYTRNILILKAVTPLAAPNNSSGYFHPT